MARQVAVDQPQAGDADLLWTSPAQVEPDRCAELKRQMEGR